eukprot:2509551-Pyramimonas_sp.AAC.1
MVHSPSMTRIIDSFVVDDTACHERGQSTFWVAAQVEAEAGASNSLGIATVGKIRLPSCAQEAQ